MTNVADQIVEPEAIAPAAAEEVLIQAAPCIAATVLPIDYHTLGERPDVVYRPAVQCDDSTIRTNRL
ncbi:hypothetical protein [Phyllobacterium bourgognense]|uniref:Uncharacterized protein n=1 Tax=Phyllobacterium bourgognense TaxID=314236 RepID=A0A368YC04_9HYPH|nr:hypothetical protein [Phyllobacterium bourgognense]RCW77781.1 hypothetical protein C7476_13711 [Phyllobacterium bourgognense]